VNRILAESYSVDGIPILTLAQEGLTHAPVVFAMHGMGGRKEHTLTLGYELAKRGLFAVSFDATLHGERFDRRLETVSFEGNVYPSDTGLDKFFLMHEIVVQNGHDIATLLEHFAGDSRVDSQNVGVTGVSLGGFSTFYVAANDPNVRAAVPIIGIPAFTERWLDVTLEAESYTQWAEAMHHAASETTAKTAFMRQIDPFDRLKAFAPKPLMMIVGDIDTDSPKIYSVRLYRSLKDSYADAPDCLRLCIHDHAAHAVTETMIHDTCDWFARYLFA
jgi:dienelactone hydrolase